LEKARHQLLGLGSTAAAVKKYVCEKDFMVIPPVVAKDCIFSSFVSLAYILHFIFRIKSVSIYNFAR